MKHFILGALRETRPERLDELWRMTDAARAQFVGDGVHLCGTIKLSNYCAKECSFCGLQMGRYELERFRLNAEQVLSCARRAADLEFDSVLLQAGTDPRLSAEWVGDLVRTIIRETGLEVALSLGERDEADLAAWRDAGARQYWLRFQSSDPTLYRLLHAESTGQSLSRVRLLGALKNLGYQIGTGMLVGIPGQRAEQLAADLELLQSLDPAVLLIGPYVAHPGTSMGRSDWRPAIRAMDQVPASASAVMRTVAIGRLLCPDAAIPSLRALEPLSDDPRPESIWKQTAGLALQRGANMLLPELTPRRHSELYTCYPRRIPYEDLDTGNGERRLREQLAALGRAFGARKPMRSAPEKTPASAPGALELRIGICMGSSCFSRGNSRNVKTIRDFLMKHNLTARVALEGHLCTGLCKQGPNVTIAGDGKGTSACVCDHQSAARIGEILELLRQRFQIKG